MAHNIEVNDLGLLLWTESGQRIRICEIDQCLRLGLHAVRVRRIMLDGEVHEYGSLARLDRDLAPVPHSIFVAAEEVERADWRGCIRSGKYFCRVGEITAFGVAYVGNKVGIVGLRWTYQEVHSVEWSKEAFLANADRYRASAGIRQNLQETGKVPACRYKGFTRD